MPAPPASPAATVAAVTAGGVADAMADPGIPAFFLVGLLGGAHCIGMCGPLVTMYSGQFGGDERGPTAYELRQHTLFNTGRTASYTVLGAIMGGLGALLVGAGGLVAAGTAVRAAVGILAGVVILAAGAGYLLRGHPRVGAGSLPIVGPAFGAVVTRLQSRVETWADGPGIVGLGAIHGLLPCPLLYPAFAYAASTGSVGRGALALAALGLGTFPGLFVYGTVLESIGPETRQRLHRALGVAFLLAGTIPLTRGLAALGVAVPQLPLPMPPLP